MLKQILVVDDDVTSLDIVAFIFEKRGYSVERAGGGRAAIDFLTENKVDLGIFDLMMPGMNGVDAVREIRERGLSDAPIIAFTAVDEDEFHSKAIEVGCNSVLTKPCSTEKLLKEINKYLDLNA